MTKIHIHDERELVRTHSLEYNTVILLILILARVVVPARKYYSYSRVCIVDLARVQASVPLCLSFSSSKSPRSIKSEPSNLK